jgi:hypothetical protein
MMRRSQQILAFLGGFVLLLAACAQKSPEEKVAELRSKYTAEVNQSGFVATPREPVPEPVAEGLAGEAAGEAVGEDSEAVPPAVSTDAAEGEEALAPPDLAPLRYDILLDILVATRAREGLPQLTVDVVHLDPQKNEKERWPVTLDTSKIHQGPGVQITQKLEDVEYSEGDFFFTEVRAGIKPEEYDRYPEFRTGG